MVAEQEGTSGQKGGNGKYITVLLNAELLFEKQDYEIKYKGLQEEIIGGNRNDANSDSHFLMIALIICAAIEGSVVQSLRETNGTGNVSDFFVRLASGLGVGIVASLFLSSSGSFGDGAFEFLPSLGLSMKVLTGFLIGMFSKELYEFLSDSIPAAFKLLRNQIKI